MRTLDFRDVLSRPQRLLSGYSLVVAVSTVAAGLTLGLSVALLVLAFGALVLVIVLLWSSLQRLTGETELTLEEALSVAAPSAEEEQKRAVLRALKDLEFEKSVGKISDEDYRTLSENYRRQAKDLMRALDASVEPVRAEIDALIAERLGEEAPAAQRKKNRRRAVKPASPSPGDTANGTDRAAEPAPPEAPATETSAPPAAVAQRQCTACRTPNDADARFCKRCGEALEASDVSA